LTTALWILPWFEIQWLTSRLRLYNCFGKPRGYDTRTAGGFGKRLLDGFQRDWGPYHIALQRRFGEHEAFSVGVVLKTGWARGLYEYLSIALADMYRIQETRRAVGQWSAEGQSKKKKTLTMPNITIRNSRFE
jgi:hypothetical protein